MATNCSNCHACCYVFFRFKEDFILSLEGRLKCTEKPHTTRIKVISVNLRISRWSTRGISSRGWSFDLGVKDNLPIELLEPHLRSAALPWLQDPWTVLVPALLPSCPLCPVEGLVHGRGSRIFAEISLSFVKGVLGCLMFTWLSDYNLKDFRWMEEVLQLWSLSFFKPTLRQVAL